MIVRDRIARHPFAAGLTEAQLDQLARCARAAEFAEGTTIFRDGGPADAFHLIVRGRVVLEQHVPSKGPVRLESLGGGDLLGLSWLFPGGHWMLDARAIAPTETVALDAACVRGCMADDVALGFAVAMHVIHQLYQRLERVRLQRLDVYGGAT